MAQTLNDIRQTLATNGQPLKFRMVDKFLGGSESKVLPRLHFIDEKSFSYEYVVVDGYGTVSSRSLNTGYNTKTSTTHREKEPMAFVGGEVKTDYAVIDVKGDEARLTEIDRKLIAAGKYFDKLFFNGNPQNPVGGVESRGNELRGLKVRAAGQQLISAGANGGALTLDLLDLAIDSVIGSNSNKVIQLNRTMRRALSKLVLNQNRVQYAVDQKKQVSIYDDCEIDVIDEDEAYNPILDFNETWGASNVTTSLYVTRFGQTDDESFVQGIIGNQWMQVRPPSPQGTYVLEVVESLLGLGNFHPRSMARIAGLTG